MANYFWVGGTGNVNNTNTANIATSSGGAGGAGPVTAADNLTFDSNSAATNYTATVSASFAFNNLNIGAPASGTLTLAGSAAMTCNGNLNVTSTSGISVTYSGTITFAATSTGKTITTNGISFSTAPVTFDGVGGSWTLVGAASFNNTTLTNGAFSDGGFNATLRTFSSSNSNIRSVTRSGIWTILASGTAYNCSTSTNLTVNDTGTVKFIETSSATKTFAGGAKSYNIVYFSGSGTGPYKISNGPTIAQVIADASTAIQTFTFDASLTTTIGSLSINGNASFQNILNSSSSGTKATLSSSSGVISLTNVSVKDIGATGGAMFEAYTDTNGCVNTSNNSGWVFFGVTGTGAGVAHAPAAAGSGHLDESGSGVGICGPPVASGSGHLDESGAGIGILAAPQALGVVFHLPIEPSRTVFRSIRRAAVISE